MSALVGATVPVARKMQLKDCADMTENTKATSITHTVTVTGYASGGEGVAHLNDGKVVFIRTAARGDKLEIEMTEEKPRSARAKIVRIQTPSPYRIEPDCPYYPKCGGCDFRHIDYDEELNIKLQRINDALERIGGQKARVSEILRTGSTEGYRNKVVLHSNQQSIGLYSAQSNEIVPIDRCLLLKDNLNDAIKNLTPGGKNTLRSGRNGLEPPLEEELDGLLFRISGFFQVNTEAALLLFERAREYAALTKKETRIDIYSGVGTLAIFVGRDAEHALGIEQNPAAVKTAMENARINGLTHIGFICADAAKWETNIPNPDCVIVDPPRKGLSPDALRKILELSPKRIVYISCDPATFARDVRMLEGYKINKICAVDMFPRTANVEVCCLLTR